MDQPTSSADSIQLVRTEGIATITIDRPEKKNAITFSMFGRLRELFRGGPQP